MIGACISGGGAKIGFAVGVLEVMKEHGIKIDLAYGVSSGSICTAALCFGSVEFLKETLLAINERKDVLKKQSFKAIWTLATGMGRADGWFEMETMRKKLDLLPLEKPNLKGVVGYVKLQSGDIEYKSSDKVSKKEFLDAVQASCSIPAYMQSQHVGDDHYVDGGVRDVLPLKALTNDSLKVDEVHVICLSPLLPSAGRKIKNIVHVATRSVDLLVNEVLQNDFDYMVLVNDLIAQRNQLRPNLQAWLTKKRTIRPFRYLPEESICETTDFCRKNIEQGITHGRSIASRVLSGYPGLPPESRQFKG